MPAGNPMGYLNNARQAGSAAAMGQLGLTPPQLPKPAGMPTPKPFQPANVSAAAPATPAAAKPIAAKLSAFSLSPDPETRAQEAKKDTTRQPQTNEGRRIAPGIDPAFNYLVTPSESDPYTTSRMF